MKAQAGLTRGAFTVAGSLLLPIVWVALKKVLGISDRYLPDPVDVVSAVWQIQPSVFTHLAFTTVRLLIGFVLGTIAGVALGLAVFKSAAMRSLTMPTIQAVRAVPAVAIVPFFLLWLGFSEIGRYLLVVAGISFNIAIAAYQILGDTPEKYRIMFRGFGVRPERLILAFALPTVAERLLPTARFSLATAIGLVVVSELLGSQIGLGYLIQTARGTFSMHLIFLATILLGLLNVVADVFLRRVWQRAVYWRAQI